MEIRVQREDFEHSQLYHQLSQKKKDIGAIVTFTGIVREFCTTSNQQYLFLEHYPGMTEQSLAKIAEAAIKRFCLSDICIVHRIGQLEVNEQIVFVGAASSHRQAAFSACEFVMDFLKNDAPFWKKEISEHRSHWIATKQKDIDAKLRW